MRENLVSVLAAVFLMAACTAPWPAVAQETVREPEVAGAFYPADSARLGEIVDMMLEGSRLIRPRVKPLGMICPHAGYPYSGPIAAAGYKQLRGYGYSTVVVVSPSHTAYFGFSAVCCDGDYATPLGTVRTDRELARRLAEASQGGLVRCSPKGHIGTAGARGMGEHALEVQLPFLQRALDDFALVPVVMGSQDRAQWSALGGALAEVLRGRDDVLLVASTDLSHFHDAAEADSIDHRLIECVGDFDTERIRRGLADGSMEACGGGAVLAIMDACRRLGADRSRIVAHANSGDMSGDNSRVVGYLSALLYDKKLIEEQALNPDQGDSMELSSEERQYLLELARGTIGAAVRGEPVAKPEPVSPVMSEKRGAFVTIKKHGELRGCIGYIVALKPLVETISEMAQSAALRDPRFPPVRPDELAELELEISVLTPVYRVDDISAIEVGKDGLIIRRGAQQGLLLPQVPTEYGWDRETFLAQTCRKAGLPPDAWRLNDTEISSFRAEVFSDRDFE